MSGSSGRVRRGRTVLFWGSTPHKQTVPLTSRYGRCGGGGVINFVSEGKEGKRESSRQDPVPSFTDRTTRAVTPYHPGERQPTGPVRPFVYTNASVWTQGLACRLGWVAGLRTTVAPATLQAHPGARPRSNTLLVVERTPPKMDLSPVHSQKQLQKNTF